MVTIYYEQIIAKEGRLYEKRKTLNNIKIAKLYKDLIWLMEDHRISLYQTPYVDGLSSGSAL